MIIPISHPSDSFRSWPGPFATPHVVALNIKVPLWLCAGGSGSFCGKIPAGWLLGLFIILIYAYWLGL